ncbi:MAG: hypothetical protein U1F11_02180 [Steroidobacteraceae bacterium]
MMLSARVPPRRGAGSRGAKPARLTAVAVARVRRLRRVRVHRATQRRDARSRRPRADQRVRRDVAFAPGLERLEVVDRSRAVATAAVAHARDHVEPREAAQRREPALRARRELVVIDGGLRRDDGIAPAVVDDELAAARAELAEVGIRSAEDLRHRTEPRRVAIEVEVLEAPRRARVLEERQVAEQLGHEALEQRRPLVAARERADPAGFGAQRRPRVECGPANRAGPRRCCGTPPPGAA